MSYDTYMKFSRCLNKINVSRCLWCRGTCNCLVDMFDPPICVSMVYICLVVSCWCLCLIEANEVKMCDIADKKNIKTKGYKQIQIYISTIHAIKYFKTLVF